MSSFNLVQIVPSLDSGGVERGTVDVANFLAEKKIQNFIITSSGKMIKELNDKYTYVYKLPVDSKNFFSYPFIARKINQFIKNNFDTEDEVKTMVDKTFNVVADCMDTVFTGEDAWDANDYSPTERIEFIEQLNSQQYKKVEKFFSTMPKLSHTIEVVNPNTKKKSSIVLEGLADFFV